MNRRIHLMAIGCVGALAGLIFLTLALTTNTPVQATVIDSPVSVSITESGFDPAVVTITVGTTVVWINDTQETVHLVGGEPYRIYLPLVLRNAGGTRAVAVSPPVADDVVAWQQDDWGNVDIAPKESYTHTFATDGKYPHFLAGHPDRTGLVVVQRTPTPDFALGVQPLAQGVTQGESVTYTVAVTALYGFDSPVTLTVGGTPTGAIVSWATNSLTPTTGGTLILTPTADAALTITPSLASPTGTYMLFITGTGDEQMHSVPTTLTITPAQFSPDSFVFPFDMAQVIAVRSQIPGVEPYFIYHITHRPDSNDPCGRHPGDCLIPLLNVEGGLNDFDISVMMLYDGVLERSWVTEPVGEHSGADLGFTFYVGDMGGHAYYLDVYHTDASPLEIGDVVAAGQVFAHLNRAKFSFGPWESKIHITLLVDGTDFMSTETADIAPFALPSTLKAAHSQGQPVAIVYEGPDFCNMTSSEMIARIVNDYLPNAGFCTDGALVAYCGSDPRFQGLSFTQGQLPPHWDGRGIELVPQLQ